MIKKLVKTLESKYMTRYGEQTFDSKLALQNISLQV